MALILSAGECVGSSKSGNTYTNVIMLKVGRNKGHYRKNFKNHYVHQVYNNFQESLDNDIDRKKQSGELQTLI